MPSSHRPNNELIFGILSPIGSNSAVVVEDLKRQLEDSFNYHVVIIKISDLISSMFEEEFKSVTSDCLFCLKRAKIFQGTALRRDMKDNSILAKWATIEIFKERKKVLDQLEHQDKRQTGRIAFIVDQLKKEEEIELLNEIYGKSFFLLGVHSPTQARINRLAHEIKKPESFAHELVNLDESEADFFRKASSCPSCKPVKNFRSPIGPNDVDYGQNLKKIFPMSDIFIADYQPETHVTRFLDLIFMSPREFPRAAEHAMFMAFSASARSADLSRQVGAVLLTASDDFISSGSNDVPKFGGGTYEPGYHFNDSVYGFEANSKRIAEIVESIACYLKENELVDSNIKTSDIHEDLRKNTEIGSLTEFHRTVHAEMQAVMNAARNGVKTTDSILFVTTFPCHNCAKHLVSAGIKQVVFIEPYPKSLAQRLHGDALKLSEDGTQFEGKTILQPFLGIGPRRFMDLFSLTLSSGQKINRKTGFVTASYKRSKSEMRFAKMFFTLGLEIKLSEKIRSKLAKLISQAKSAPSQKGATSKQLKRLDSFFKIAA